MAEINLLKNYPLAKRSLGERAEQKTEAIRNIAKQFGEEYFDGERIYGYGGYRYHPRFWQPVVPTFQEHFQLSSGSRILDVGCAKGFMLYDFMQLIPGIKVEGIDISPYAIDNAKSDMRPFLKLGNAKELPYPDQFFDVVFSINTVHNLELEECKQALREVQRVAKRGSFITVDSYCTDEEKNRMDTWNLTAKTYMHVKHWKELFEEVGYAGDYYWFVP